MVLVELLVEVDWVAVVEVEVEVPVIVVEVEVVVELEVVVEVVEDVVVDVVVAETNSNVPFVVKVWIVSAPSVVIVPPVHVPKSAVTYLIITIPFLPAVPEASALP